jgi:hypothetical protein
MLLQYLHCTEYSCEVMTICFFSFLFFSFYSFSSCLLCIPVYIQTINWCFCIQVTTFPVSCSCLDSAMYQISGTSSSSSCFRCLIMVLPPFRFSLTVNEIWIYQCTLRCLTGHAPLLDSTLPFSRQAPIIFDRVT